MFSLGELRSGHVYYQLEACSKLAAERINQALARRLFGGCFSFALTTIARGQHRPVQNWAVKFSLARLSVRESRNNPLESATLDCHPSGKVVAERFPVTASKLLPSRPRHLITEPKIGRCDWTWGKDLRH